VLTAISRLFIFLLCYPPIFATQFIPGAGVFIHAVLAALYGAFVLSIDFSDPTFERHLDRFRDKVRFIWRRKALYLGFGLTAVGMAIIPIVNFLLLPLGVAAAAILYLEEMERGSTGGR
jgi:CysZ protein